MVVCQYIWYWLQIARFEAVMRYISEYPCICVKKYQMILSYVKIKRVLIACQIINIEMNLRNIELL